MKIIRVFPTKTSFTPDDEYCFYGFPPHPTMLPHHDAVHISVVFTWDIPKAESLRRNWDDATDKPVMVGGPALGDRGSDFVPGRYCAYGVTITSRGCNNKCPFCYVPGREGPVRELPIVPGNVVQDNNILQCSDAHVSQVFNMLRSQYKVKLSGGLEADRITSKIAGMLKGIRLFELWTAYDVDADYHALEKAAGQLTAFHRNQKRCYVLVGYGNDTKDRALARLITAYELGYLPFAQLYMSGDAGRDQLLHAEWHEFTRTWSRPAAFKTYIKKHGVH